MEIIEPISLTTNEEEEKPPVIGSDGLTDQARTYLMSLPVPEERQRQFLEWYGKNYPNSHHDWIAKTRGAWPGDEPDEDLQAALKAMG